MNTRWDPANALCLCVSCHRKGHDRPTEFSEWVFENMGTEKYLNLKKKSLELGKYLVYEDILKEIEK